MRNRLFLAVLVSLILAVPAIADDRYSHERTHNQQRSSAHYEQQKDSHQRNYRWQRGDDHRRASYRQHERRQYRWSAYDRHRFGRHNPRAIVSMPAVLTPSIFIVLPLRW